MKTHYDVLNLDKTCSAKDIKESFIKLSKKYHPDKNKNLDAHKKFVEVNEAYSVLGKAHTRCQYDESLLCKGTRMQNGFGSKTTATTGNTSYEHYTYMYTRNLKRNQENVGNHFIAGKLKVFVFCCLLMMIGSGLQVKAALLRRDRRSQEIARILKESKERKKNLSKEQKIAIMQAEMLINKPENERK